MIAGRLVGAEVVRLAAMAAVSGRESPRWRPQRRRGVTAMATVSGATGVRDGGGLGRATGVRDGSGPAQETAWAEPKAVSVHPGALATSVPGFCDIQQMALMKLPRGLRPK